MKKIVFVNRYFYPDLSATSQMLSDLAFALADAGIPVCVVTGPQTYENPDARLPGKENIGGVDVIRVWTTRFGRMNLAGRALDYVSFYFAAFVTLLRIVRADDVIVAKTDPPLISVVGWIVAKVKKARLVNWLQDVFPEVATALGVLKSPTLARFVKRVRNVSLRGAAMNVVLGERMRAIVVSEGVDHERTRIIHNWADGALVRPIRHETNRLRAEWGLQEKFVIGYSGNMGRAHEFDTITDAMRRLKIETDIVFLFIGGGAGRAGLEKAAAEQGLTNCLFQPYQPRERLSESLSVPDVHLVSLQPVLEGLIVPSKIYGIAAAGRPVVFIGDPDGEVARLLVQCGCGVTVPVGSGEALSRALAELKQNPEMLASMGERARQCLDEHYEKAHAIRAWRAAFQELDVVAAHE